MFDSLSTTTATITNPKTNHHHLASSSSLQKPTLNSGRIHNPVQNLNSLDLSSTLNSNSSIYSELPILNQYSTTLSMAPPQTNLSSTNAINPTPTSQDYSYQQPISSSHSPHYQHSSGSSSVSSHLQNPQSLHHHQQQQQQNTQIISPEMISGTGASTNPPTLNSKIHSKFSNHDIQILKQLLIAGEKHKWKQITKEINQSTNHNNHVLAAIQSAAEKGQTYYGNLTGGGYSNKREHNGASSLASTVDHTTTSNIPTKNVSPTFVVKQYQQLLGLPNNTLFFGSLQSSLPYVVAENGWNDIPQDAYNYGFNNDAD